MLIQQLKELVKLLRHTIADSGTGSHSFYVDASEVLNMTVTAQTLGISGDSRITIDQSSNTVDAYAGSSQIISATTTNQKFGKIDINTYVQVVDAINNSISHVVDNTGVTSMTANDQRFGTLSGSRVLLNQGSSTTTVYAGSNIILSGTTTSATLGDSSDTFVTVDDSADTVTIKAANQTQVLVETTGTTISDDLTVTGDLFVDGTTFVVNNQEVTTADNIIVLNDGEVGPGVTAGTAGIEIDRGSSTNYRFIFQESDDTFRIGEIGSTQAVATREDSPSDTRVTWWNNSSKRFDTLGDSFITVDTSTHEIAASANSVEVLNLQEHSQVFGDASDINITIDQTSGQNIELQISASAVFTAASNGITLASGTNINEFSTDTTLAGDSDNAVPTEKAVKTYVDNAVAGLNTNKIWQDDSYVEVTDDGTASGNIVIVADGVSYNC
jgi:hypothetical protein